jgi:hypothetical protein
MLWTFLTAASSVSLFLGAVQAAGPGTASTRRALAVITIGLLLGILNFWVITWKLVSAVDRLIQRYSTRGQQWFLGALFLAAVLWTLLALPTGRSVASAMIRLTNL